MGSGAAFGIAYYLDSERYIIERAEDPNSTKVAQVEREIMGGAPLSQVTLKVWWKPNWGIALCQMAEFYADAELEVRWLDDQKVEIQHGPDASYSLIHQQECHGAAPVFVENDLLYVKNI